MSTTSRVINTFDQIFIHTGASNTPYSLVVGGDVNIQNGNLYVNGQGFVGGGGTGATGPRGPTGAAGQNAVSGGLTLFMDTAGGSYVNTPIVGSLLQSPNQTAGTTILSGNQPIGQKAIAQFLTASNTLQSTVILGGLWDMNLYASSSVTSNFYWFNVAYVDSNGNNRVNVATGTATNETNIGTALTYYNNSLYVPTFTLPDLTYRVLVEIVVDFQSNNRSCSLYFRNNEQSHVHTTIQGNFYGPTGAQGPTGPGFTTITNAMKGNLLTATSANSANAEPNLSFVNNIFMVTGGVQAFATMSGTYATFDQLKATTFTGTNVFYGSATGATISANTSYLGASTYQSATGGTLSANTSYIGASSYQSATGATLSANTSYLGSANFQTAVGSTLTSTNVIYTTLTGSNISYLTSTGATLSANTSYLGSASYQSATGATLTANTIVFGTQTGSNINFMNATGATLSVNTSYIGTTTFQNASGTNLSYINATGATLSANTIYGGSHVGTTYTGAGMYTDTLYATTMTGSTLTFRTGTGTTFGLNQLYVGNALIVTKTGASSYVDTLYATAMTGSTLTFRTGTGTTLGLNQLYVGSALVISQTGASLYVDNLYPTSLTGSTMTMRTASINTTTGASIYVDTLYATAMTGSTLTFRTGTGTTLGLNQLYTNNALIKTSTGSAVYADTVYGTIMTGTSLTFNTATGSLLGLTTINTTNTYAKQVAINTASFQNKLDVFGSVAIGSYGGANAAPSNGLIVSGNTSIGTSSNTNKLDVSGGVAIGSYAAVNTSPSNGLIVSGNTSIGTTLNQNKLDVSGGVAIGSFAGANAAPTNGLIVSGNVGIGQSSSSYALSVNGTCYALTYNLSNASFTSSGNDIYLNTNGANSIYLRPGGAGSTTFQSVYSSNSISLAGGALYINSFSNIGIGTTTPLNTLHVASGAVTGITDLLNLTSYTTSFGSNQSSSSILFSTKNAGNGAIYSLARVRATDNIAAGGTSGYGDLVFDTYNNFVSYERMRIRANGTVGINTSTPATFFQVNTNTVSDVAATIGFNTNPGTRGGGYYVGPALNFAAATFYGDPYVAASICGGNQCIGGRTTTGFLQFLVSKGDNATPPTAAMIIANDGNVGIGTTNPSRTLEVSNTANDSYIRISSSSQKALEFYDLANAATRWVNYVDGADTRLRWYNPTANRDVMILDVNGTLSQYGSHSIINTVNDAYANGLFLTKQRPNGVKDGNELGYVMFQGTDNSANIRTGAYIIAASAFDWTSSNAAANINIYSCNYGSVSPSLRAQFGYDGRFRVFNPTSTDGAYMFFDSTLNGSGGTAWGVGSSLSSNGPGLGKFEIFNPSGSKLILDGSGNIFLSNQANAATYLKFASYTNGSAGGNPFPYLICNKAGAWFTFAAINRSSNDGVYFGPSSSAGAIGTTCLSMLDSGNVGIGTSNPSYLFTVSGSRYNVNVEFDDSYTQLAFITSKCFGTNTNGWTTIDPNVLQGGGIQGLGVYDNFACDTSITLGVYNYATNGKLEIAGTIGGYSMYTSGDISVNNTTNRSDQRIKTDIKPVPLQSCLDMVNQYQVVSYDYVNSFVNSGTGVVGFIAQQIASVDPNAVAYTCDYIPNINQWVTLTQQQNISETGAFIYSFTLPTGTTGSILSVGDKVQFNSQTGSNVTNRFVTITSVDNTRYSFKDGMELPTDMFCYGTYVTNFTNLKKDRIFAYGIGAIQDLSQEVVMLKERLATSESKYTSLLQTIINAMSFADLQNKVMDL